MATSAIAWLGTRLPPLPVGRCYVLLEAGPLLPTTGPLGSYTVQGRFLVRAEEHDDTRMSGDRIVACPIPLPRAGLLIPGSRWSAAGSLLSSLPAALPVETRALSFGAHRLIARQLHHLFPTADRPTALQLRGLQGWYLTLDTATERVLLPCFEVARAFYYASGPQVVNFCLSRLALDRICWPLASPDETLHQTAHFCVAAHTLRPTEIRLFAEMLFNPSCNHTIRLAHSRLAQAWARRSYQPDIPAPWLRLDWELGHDVFAQARGESFHWQGKAYFLVHSLVPAPDWHRCHGVVCHLLGSPAATQTKRLFPATTPVIPVISNLFPTFSFGLREQVAVEQAMTLQQVPLEVPRPAPPVFLAGCWAVASLKVSTAACYPTAESIRPYLWDGCQNYPVPVPSGPAQPLATQLPELARLIAHLAFYIDRVQPIELHNPGQEYGRGVSCFPPGSLPSVRTHLLSHRFRPLGLFQLEYGGAHYYLMHLEADDRLILFYDRQLTRLSEVEITEVLYQISYCRASLVDLRPDVLHNTGKLLALVTHASAPVSLLQAWCRQQIQWNLCLCNAYHYLRTSSAKWTTDGRQPKSPQDLFYLAARYLERGYLHFPGLQLHELPDKDIAMQTEVYTKNTTQ